jgi:hypothetical protein
MQTYPMVTTAALRTLSTESGFFDVVIINVVPSPSAIHDGSKSFIFFALIKGVVFSKLGNALPIAANR